MSVKNFIPELWAGEILRTLEGITIARQICNTKHEGQIKNHGDRVRIVGLADPTINDYTSTVTYEELQDASETLVIDQKKYFAFKLDDVDKAQAGIDLMSDQNKRAAYKLRDTADEYVFGLYGSAGNTVTDSTLDTATLLSTLALVGQKLDENDVGSEGRWMVIPPWVKTKLLIIGFKWGVDKNGIEFVKEMGFTFYVSNNLTDLGTSNHQILAGSPNAIAYADQILSVEAMRLESYFSDAIRGLHVYGAKVVKPKELVLLNATYAAESAI